MLNSEFQQPSKIQNFLTPSIPPVAVFATTHSSGLVEVVLHLPIHHSKSKIQHRINPPPRPAVVAKRVGGQPQRHRRRHPQSTIHNSKIFLLPFLPPPVTRHSGLAATQHPKFAIGPPHLDNYVH